MGENKMSEIKVRKKKKASVKQYKISSLHAKGRNPSVSMHTTRARAKAFGGAYWIFGAGADVYFDTSPGERATAYDLSSDNELTYTSGENVGEKHFPGIKKFVAAGKSSVHFGKSGKTYNIVAGGGGQSILKESTV
jgi:hypothetical protein